jgi:peptidoglycan L-alanyl-D-glutamate endopeptidase CwlK
MAFKLGARSEKNLEGVHPDLVRVLRRALEITQVDVTILDGGGLRTLAQAQDNAARGTGIVNSLHRKQPDGFGHAIDAVAYPVNWGNDKANLDRFREVARAVKRAAAELRVPIRQGLDWDMDGVWSERGEYDMPHFEMPKPWHLPRAIELMERHREELGLTNEPVPGQPEPGVTLYEGLDLTVVDGKIAARSKP